MSRKMRRWTALWTIFLLGTLAPGARAQQVKPNVWQPIDVWGVSGHPIGTIIVGQRTVNGVLRYDLVGEFKPAKNLLLAQLAAQLWPGANPTCLHFNWIQIAVNTGNPPTPLDATGQVLIAPFVDPPIGGYQVIAGQQQEPKPADALPWFLDETPFNPKKSANLNINNANIRLPNALRWYVSPYSAVTPDTMRYDTVLVLVNDCTAQYEPLGGFHWQAIFPSNGTPQFEIMPFGKNEWFANGALVTAFNKTARLKQKAKPWTIRPLVKP